MAELETLSSIKPSTPANLAVALTGETETIDKALGQGAAEILNKVTVNIGTINGGVKVNMIPGKCVMECDIRLPVNLDKETVMAELNRICDNYSGVSYRVINHTPPSFCDPDNPMVHCLQSNAKEIIGIKPKPIVSLGGTDARLWRHKGIPAFVYGPFPRNMGAADEYVEVEEFLNILKIHLRSSFDYLQGA